jgi:hypothetical protein
MWAVSRKTTKNNAEPWGQLQAAALTYPSLKWAREGRSYWTWKECYMEGVTCQEPKPHGDTGRPSLTPLIPLDLLMVLNSWIYVEARRKGGLHTVSIPDRAAWEGKKWRAERKKFTTPTTFKNRQEPCRWKVRYVGQVWGWVSAPGGHGVPLEMRFCASTPLLETQDSLWG